MVGSAAGEGLTRRRGGANGQGGNADSRYTTGGHWSYGESRTVRDAGPAGPRSGPGETRSTDDDLMKRRDFIKTVGMTAAGTAAMNRRAGGTPVGNPGAEP